MKNMGHSVVLKFGGAALSKVSNIHFAAQIIKDKLFFFEKVIIVVSAMGKMTDRLLKLAHKISDNPPLREQDMLISVGERISMSLLAMALHKEGIESKSFTGSQSGIITTNDHLNAKIIDVRPFRLIESLENYRVVIVAGFQGVSQLKEITTLGRGGSDTTAVALAIALNSDSVEFYKDVDGIYDDDPKINPSAIINNNLGYEEALKIINRCEKKILHPRAVELAKKNKIDLKIVSYENPEVFGTIISGAKTKPKQLIYEQEVREISPATF